MTKHEPTPDLTLTEAHTSPKERPGRIRVYVSGYHPTDVKGFPGLPNRDNYATVEAWGEAMVAYNELAGACRRVRNQHIAPTVRKAICDAFGLASAPRMTWQAKAGCSCGCSPAFVLDMRGSHDLFLTILTPAGSAHVAARKAEAQAREAARLEEEGRGCYQI